MYVRHIFDAAPYEYKGWFTCSVFNLKILLAMHICSQLEVRTMKIKHSVASGPQIPASEVHFSLYSDPPFSIHP